MILVSIFAKILLCTLIFLSGALGALPGAFENTQALKRNIEISFLIIPSILQLLYFLQNSFYTKQLLCFTAFALFSKPFVGLLTRLSLN
jgi:hypothetical protein